MFMFIVYFIKKKVPYFIISSVEKSTTSRSFLFAKRGEPALMWKRAPSANSQQQPHSAPLELYYIKPPM